VDVDLERQLPLLVRNVFDRFEGGLMRRIVHENINATEFGKRFGNDRTTMIRLLYRQAQGWSSCLPRPHNARFRARRHPL
jgi:hypothetical protein